MLFISANSIPMKYPRWFPYPSSWLDAILLTLLTAGIIRVIEVVLKVGAISSYALEDMKPFLFCLFIALLSPIPIIAWVHHLIHLLLSKGAPKLQNSEMANTKGLFPSLLSWWEGLWSWTVMTLSFITIMAAILLTYKLFNFDPQIYIQGSIDRYKQFELFIFSVWLLTSAYLYQIAHLVEQKLLRTAQSSLPTK